MTTYYVDWTLSTGGEFFVRADTEEQAKRILQDVINHELDRQTLDASDAEITYGTDDEDDDGYTPVYELGDDGAVRRTR